MAIVLELPVRRNQTAFNLKRWDELLSDPYYANIEGRVETNRHGEVIMSPPASQYHGSYQFLIGQMLDGLMPKGRIVTECPISTEDGVRAADVAWMSLTRVKRNAGHACLIVAPEICVEVLSRSNTKSEIEEITALYFAAKAKEVWCCDKAGRMRFFLASENEVHESKLCPGFPRVLHLF